MNLCLLKVQGLPECPLFEDPRKIRKKNKLFLVDLYGDCLQDNFLGSENCLLTTGFYRHLFRDHSPNAKCEIPELIIRKFTFRTRKLHLVPGL
jgi:hypothetical protein